MFRQWIAVSYRYGHRRLLHRGRIVRDNAIALPTPETPSLGGAFGHVQLEHLAESALSPQSDRLLFFVNNVYPLRLYRFDLRPYFFRFFSAKYNHLHTTLSKVVPPELAPQLRRVLPRYKDGGVLLEFSAHGKSSDVLLSRIRAHLKQQPVPFRQWFNGQTIDTFAVKGKPFLEDLLDSIPSPLLRIETANAPSLETLYNTLRPFGPLARITPGTPSYIAFQRARSATSAKMCLNEWTAEGAVWRLRYEPVIRPKMIRSWLVGHPRVTIPVLAAIGVGLGYAIFDPIRVFNIKNKLSSRVPPLFSSPLSTSLRSLSSVATSLGFTKHAIKQPAQFDLFSGVTSLAKDIEAYLATPPGTFLVIAGPAGIGKSEMLTKILDRRQAKLVLDLSKLSANGGTTVMTGLAKQTGYWPQFAFMAKLNNLVDIAATATVGSKVGLSSTQESDIARILELTAVALSDLTKAELQRQKAKRKSVTDEDDSIPMDNELDYPVVVINNYRDAEKAAPNVQMLVEQIEKWAGVLVENGIAHVIFTAPSTAIPKTLAKVTPSRAYQTVVFSDMQKEQIRQFVSERIGEKRLEEVGGHKAVEPFLAKLGGRIQDLEAFVQRIRSGVTPAGKAFFLPHQCDPLSMSLAEASHDILEKALLEVRKFALGQQETAWTVPQFWEIIRLFKAHPKAVVFGEALHGPVLKGDQAPLMAMEQAELIAMTNKGGIPDRIKPFKPVYVEAIQQLLKDKVFVASMDYTYFSALTKDVTTKMKEMETELAQLRHIKGAKRREKYLLKQLDDAQQKLQEYNEAVKEAKAIATKGYPLHHHKQTPQNAAKHTPNAFVRQYGIGDDHYFASEEEFGLGDENDEDAFYRRRHVASWSTQHVYE